MVFKNTSIPLIYAEARKRTISLMALRNLGGPWFDPWIDKNLGGLWFDSWIDKNLGGGGSLVRSLYRQIPWGSLVRSPAE